jgi:RNase H-like domain found in reverse transcriptase
MGMTAFDDIKKLIAKEALLTYPNFKKPFEIHTDASKSSWALVYHKKENLSPSIAES